MAEKEEVWVIYVPKNAPNKSPIFGKVVEQDETYFKVQPFCPCMTADNLSTPFWRRVNCATLTVPRGLEVYTQKHNAVCDRRFRLNQVTIIEE